MTNLEIAKLLRKMAAAYTVLGENRFKIIAYDNAATAVEHSTSELKDIWDDGKLDAIPGLGSSIQSHLDELFKTGHSTHFEKVLANVNPAIFPLLEIPGIGPKKAQTLVKELGINNAQTAIASLEKSANEHKIASIESFGEKSEQDILSNIERYKKGSVKEIRMPLPVADSIADELIEYLKNEIPEKIKVIEKLGSLRRCVATIGDIDLAVSTDFPEEILDTFIKFPKRVGLIEKGPAGASLLLASGRQCDLRVASPNGFGAMLQYFTGSKYHNIRLREYALKKGYSLNEYGIKSQSGKNKALNSFRTEKEFYGFLGLDYIPPELREDHGEILAAQNHTLPDLIRLEDVRGDLQMHTNFDLETSHDSGLDTIEAMQSVAKSLGYRYIGITNHNSSSKHSAKEMVEKIKRQRDYIAKLNENPNHVKLISMMEVDISPDGLLPVPQEGLDLLDACLVSIHSNFNLDKETMTNRVIKGLSNPVAKIFAHPTGRLIGEREGYELDWPKIFDFCVKNDKALEINCHPSRLDLPDILVQDAVKQGVLLSLGTDSHDKESLVNMRYGVSVARRGWAEKKNIINCREYVTLIKWFRNRNPQNKSGR